VVAHAAHRRERAVADAAGARPRADRLGALGDATCRRQSVVDAMSFDIGDGEVIAILGPSGAARRRCCA
jgi:ABC-type glutathione transport system ATPase component